MENNSHPLATESFSYSWLVADIDKPHSYDDSFLNNLRQTTFPDEKEQNIFNFDIHVSESPANLAHADEIFSNGHIKPMFLNRSEETDFTKFSISVPSSPLFTNASERETGERRRSASSSSKGILRKCYRFVKQRLGCSRKSNRVDDLVRKVYEVRSFSDDSFEESRLSSGYAIKTDERVDFGCGVKEIESLQQASPWLSPARSCSEVESSIHEAILYCKRSIEK